MKIDGMQVHKNITVDVLEDAVKLRMTTLDNPGFCLSCGNEQGGCEPDARKIECEACGTPTVYGADDLFMAMAW